MLMYAINMDSALLILSPSFLKSWKVIRLFIPLHRAIVHTVTIKIPYCLRWWASNGISLHYTDNFDSLPSRQCLFHGFDQLTPWRNSLRSTGWIQLVCKIYVTPWLLPIFCWKLLLWAKTCLQTFSIILVAHNLTLFLLFSNMWGMWMMYIWST